MWDTRLFLKAEIDAEALVSSDKKFQILTQRTQRKWDRTEEILVGLYNFKNEFLATEEELIVNWASLSTSIKLWTILYIITKS